MRVSHSGDDGALKRFRNAGIFKTKWGIVAEAAIITLPLLGVKALFHLLDWELISVGPIITALVAGVFFVLAILLSGVLQDFKESEKMSGEVAACIEALYKDSRLTGKVEESAVMLSHLRGILHAMVFNFERGGVWELGEINPIVDRIDDSIRSFAEKGVPAPLLVKMRNELGNLKKISNRVYVIKETSFAPSAYAIAELATGAALLVLLLSKTGTYYEGLLLVGVLSLVLISVILLIKDMDNPFEGHSIVDMSHLHKLEEYLDNR